MELVDIRDAAKYRAGMDTNDAMVSDDVINSFVNAALRQVNMIQDWDWAYRREILTFNPGVARYTRGATCRKSDRVFSNVDGRTLTQANKRMVTRLRADDSTGGRPRYWYIEGGELWVYPTPTETEQHVHIFVESEPKLIDDQDEPLIPDWAVDIVIVKTAKMITARTDNTSQQRLLAEEERSLLDALDDEAKSSRGHVSSDARRDWGV